ncbi:MAG: OmpA family protein [Bacteroidales bacterium]|nr:OmpA family protein [Bacteroidales bacterium]
MKPIIHFKVRIQSRKILPVLMLCAAFFFGITTTQAQEDSYTRPTWMFGIAGGANFNYYNGSTQSLNSSLSVPTTFHKATGTGLYLAPLIEYHPVDSRWGLMLQSGYDNRKGFFDAVVTPCNCIADLSANISYLTIEPSLRFAPFKGNFYLYGGPRVAYNLAKSFSYTQGTNPLYPNQIANPNVNGDLSSMRKTVVSMQIAAGYDIQLSSTSHRTQFVFSPFVSFQPYFGQNPRWIETLNLTTLRVGAALKFGRGHRVVKEPVIFEPVVAPSQTVFIDSEVLFSANAPKNIPTERRVREVFPLRNYIFFDLGSNEIPERYVLLKKSEVKDFKEDQMEIITPKRIAGRSVRQMNVYYNVINILGDRMQKDPSTTILLVGSSDNGPKEGRIMAESVKHYLIDVFEIDANRISIEGRYKPKIPSEQVGGDNELVLLREGDRRVSIESSSPALLMEFVSGKSVPLKPIEIVETNTAPLDSYVTFNLKGGNDSFSTWSIKLTDQKGVTQNFGPYTSASVSIPGKAILGTQPEGDYHVEMTGTTKGGKVVTKETTIHIVLWTPPTNEEIMRFSILFEFNQSKAINMYKKYITEVIAPKIPQNGSVIIHGYSDVIGDSIHNEKLSMARAMEVRQIIEKQLSKVGRKDVKFEIYGFGEEKTLTPFENKYPEERFYNRTVLIDLYSKK